VKLTEEELLAIFSAGGRNSGERSRALPSSAYRDPAETFEFPGERERRRKAKKMKNQNRRSR